MDGWLLGYQLASSTANSYKYYKSIEKDGIAALAGDINAASAFVNDVSGTYDAIKGISPSIGFSLAAFQLNKVNLAAQLAALAQAIKENDAQGIAKGIVGTVGAIAGIVGSIPALPPQIAVPARALKLGCAALSLLLDDPVNLGALSDAVEATLDAVRDAADQMYQGLMDLRWENLMSDLEGVSQSVADPLTLDLDGDGLETTGVSPTNPILFDYTGSGIKTATGWLSPDDGFLVLDRNLNGVIDSGRELFGDSTIKRDGQRAADGFDALRDLDSNADGKISALDSRFAELRLWRDLNQDGISQGNELFTLGQLNVASINVAASAHSQTLANGNQIADLGTYTRSDGSLGTTGEVTGNLADINLVGDTFHREFTDTLDTTAVAALPDMRGSGAVRDLREAATLSPTLAALSSATPRQTLKSAVALVIEQWADTVKDARLATDPPSGFADLMDVASATHRTLDSSGWSGSSKVAWLLETHPAHTSFRTVLADNGYQVKGMPGFTGGGTTSETIIGENTAEDLSAEDGDDVFPRQYRRLVYVFQ